MDRKTKVFFWVLVVATLVSIVLVFNRAFITKDYEIIEDVPDVSQL